VKIVVVGAGFAGLAAAHVLTDRGAEVVVFEARDRVGGRVRSHTLANGCVVELGGEFILPGHDTVRRLANELGLRLYEKGTAYGNREPRGGLPVTREEVTAAIASVAAHASSQPLPVALGRAGVPEAAREAILARIEVTTAYPADDQPSSVLAESGTAFGDFVTHGIEGGNERLAAELARTLDVRLGRRIEHVRHSERGVEVADTQADACVLAIPVDGLPEFDPPLPGWKQRAQAAVRYGSTGKLFLPLAQAAPPSATLSVPGRFWTYTQLAPSGDPLPVACSFGRPGEDWPAEVRALRPDLAYDDGAIPVQSHWPAAYSARSLGSRLDDDALALPVGRLAFAGEHTAGNWNALMEGALRSGERAAADVYAAASRIAR
jgi:monoamine oxidase